MNQLKFAQHEEPLRHMQKSKAPPQPRDTFHRLLAPVQVEALIGVTPAMHDVENPGFYINTYMYTHIDI